MDNQSMSLEAFGVLGRQIAEAFLRASMRRDFHVTAMAELRNLRGRMADERDAAAAVVNAAIEVLEDRVWVPKAAQDDRAVLGMLALKDAIEAAGSLGACHMEQSADEPTLSVRVGTETKVTITCAKLARNRFDLCCVSRRPEVTQRYSFNLCIDAIMQQLALAKNA